jgi:hypothetical protein
VNLTGLKWDPGDLLKLPILRRGLKQLRKQLFCRLESQTLIPTHAKILSIYLSF